MYQLMYNKAECCKVDCEQSLIFLCKVTARNITSWFAVALAESRTTRILREKADCKQSSCKEYMAHSQNFAVFVQLAP